VNTPTYLDPRAVPVPRPVRRKPGGSFRFWFPRVFILPHLIVGVGALGYALFLTSFLLFGETTEGVITAKETGSDDDGPVYRLLYTYRYNGEEYSAEDRVDHDLFRVKEPGDHITVRIHSLVPGFSARLEGNTEGWSIAMTWVFALFWNAVLSAFIWFLWILPWFQRRLVQTGEAVEGVITRKEEDTGGDSTTWAVHYEFTPAMSAAMTAAGPLRGRMNVGKEEYAVAQTGERVVILYDPLHPSRNCVYRYAPYDIRSPR
jgi:hypothetical protein